MGKLLTKKKFQAGCTYRVALNRIRLRDGEEPHAIPSSELRELVFRCNHKNLPLQDRYKEIPPITAIFDPKYATRHFVLVKGDQHYWTAKRLGQETMLCTIIEEGENGYSLWFDE